MTVEFSFFYDFSTNCYEFSKFSAKCSCNVCRLPPGIKFYIYAGVPGRSFSAGEVTAGPFSAREIAGGMG